LTRSTFSWLGRPALRAGSRGVYHIKPLNGLSEKADPPRCAAWMRWGKKCGVVGRGSSFILKAGGGRLRVRLVRRTSGLRVQYIGRWLVNCPRRDAAPLGSRKTEEGPPPRFRQEKHFGPPKDVVPIRNNYDLVISVKHVADVGQVRKQKTEADAPERYLCSRLEAPPRERPRGGRSLTLWSRVHFV